MTNAGNYSDTYTGITKGAPLSAATMTAALNTKEKVANKQVSSTDDTADTLTANSSDSYYPSAKLAGKNLDALRNDKQDKLAADIAKNIVAYSGTAGTLGTLTRTTTIDTATNASDDSIPTEKAVATALSGKLEASSLETLQTEVSSLQTSISGLQTELPKGTILMYDGTGWQDNITLPGWYCCDLVNRNKGLTPNLEDKFIKGNGSLASTGGSNALTAAMLPKHTHSIYTNATKETDRSKDKELKGTADCAEEDQDRSGIFSFSVEKTYYGWTRGAQDNPRLLIDATHEHTGHANNDNSNTTDSNTSNMPLYYSLIYIRRCA